MDGSLRKASLGVVVVFLLPHLSRGAFLNVQFGETADPTVQTGFQLFPASTATSPAPTPISYPVSDPSVAASQVTVGLENGYGVGATGILAGGTEVTSRYRGYAASTGTFTYGSMYGGMIFSTGGNFLSTQISGVNPNTPYQVTLYAYDNSNSQTISFYNITGSTGGSPITPGPANLIGSFTYTAPYSFTSTTPNSIFSVTVSATSDQYGNLTFADTSTPNNGDQGFFDGLQVAAAPEPGVGGIVLGAGGLLLARRRRR